MGDWYSPGLSRGDDGLCATFGEQFAEVVSVVALVGEQTTKWAGSADQSLRHADIVDVSGAEQQHARTAPVIDQAM